MAFQRLFEIALLHRRQRMVDDDQLGLVLLHDARPISSTLPVPSSVAGRGSVTVTISAMDDVEVDGARPARPLLRAAPRASARQAAADALVVLRRAESRVRTGTTTTARVGVAAVRVVPATVVPAGLPPCVVLSVNQASRPLSSPSNICTGWLGMMVEIACL